MTSAAELEAAARAEFPATDVLLMAAAVADFRPSAPRDTKIVKTGREGLAIELEPTTDVLATLGGLRRPGQTLVGFAAEHGDGAVERGRGKLERKHLDAVVVNDIARPDIGFDSDHNEVTIVTRDRRPGRAARAQGSGGGEPCSTRSRGSGPAPGRRVPLREIMSESAVYDLFKKGSELLEAGRLQRRRRSRSSAPARSTPTRARSARRSAAPTSARLASSKAAEEFAALVERYPVNDYAHFCLGRSLEKTGRRREARRHAVLAAGMRPDRADYRALSERLSARA